MPAVRYVHVGAATDDGAACRAVRYQTRDIPPGDPGILETAHVMRDLIAEAQQYPVVRAHAERAVRGVPPGQPLQEIRAVYDYLGRRVEYRRDPRLHEWIRTPWYLLTCELDRGQTPQLDCDDLVTLSLALLSSVGFDTAIRVVAIPRPGVPDNREYNHVYGLVELGPSRVVPVDLTRYHVPSSAPWPLERRAFEVAV